MEVLDRAGGSAESGVEPCRVFGCVVDERGGEERYPVPHAYEGARPLIDWAVMQAPFGNEFCLVRELTGPEREALAIAAEQGPAEDAHWPAVARTARRSG